MPARATLRVRVITRMRQRVIDAEIDASTNDLRFRHLDQRRDQSRFVLLDSAARAFENHLLKRVDEFWPAVGIAAVVDRIDPGPDLLSIARFGESEGQREEDAVACGDVGDRDARRADRILWNSDVARQRARAEDAQASMPAASAVRITPELIESLKSSEPLIKTLIDELGATIVKVEPPEQLTTNNEQLTTNKLCSTP